MPATPADPSRRTTRRDQRSGGQRRSWSALDTPHGFERCVRATLRELYGYVALLTGRDRREAERIVGDVYRSLFRAAGAGHVGSVTLGALRSAARRTWLDAHRIELATTDEVSRAAASTIAELSPLERAVLVLLHVNGMSTERAALELGRAEREVAAVGAHAVRRLRGTDDTSGAWLRAYLGPTVTPTPGLVDRVVQQLGESDAADGDPDGDPAAEHASGTVDDDLDGTEEPAARAGESDAVASDAGSEAGDAGAAMETTELAIVDRPTVEVPTIVAPDAVPIDVEPDGDVDPDVDVAGIAARSHDAAVADAAEQGRPRWVLAIGAALVVALVVALVWLALRGDPGDTVESTPGPSTDAAPVDDATATDADATDTAVTDADTQDADAATGDAAEQIPSGVQLGFDPTCAERVGNEPAARSWDATFGPLGDDPVLTVTLPMSVDAAADPERAAARASTILRPDGLVVAVQPAEGHAAEASFVARIGLDGTVAWVRCFDDVVRIGSSPDAGVDLAVRPVADGGAWSALVLADGSDGEPLDDAQVAALDAPDADRDGDGDAPALGYSYDSELGRSVLAGLDAGTVVWTAPDVVLATDGGFRSVTVGDTALVQSCGETEDGIDCSAGDLRGYDLVSGELLWSRPGAHRVAASGDGVALVGDGSGWELVDVRTGDGVADQRWDASTFDVGAGDAAGFVVRDGGALVVARPDTLAVWLPRDASGTTGETVDVALP